MAIHRSRLHTFSCATGVAWWCVLVVSNALPVPSLTFLVGAFVSSPSRASARPGRRRAALDHRDGYLPSPDPDLDAHAVVTLCMQSLLQRKDGTGLDVCFAFSSDRCRAALGGSLEKFRQYAANPVFGYLVNCNDWETLSIGPVIEGTATRGAMQTVLMAAFAGSSAEPRTFLWTLQRERRPPLQGCWIIHEVLYVKNAYAQTI